MFFRKIDSNSNYEILICSSGEFKSIYQLFGHHIPHFNNVNESHGFSGLVIISVTAGWKILNSTQKEMKC